MTDHLAEAIEAAQRRADAEANPDVWRIGGSRGTHGLTIHLGPGLAATGVTPALSAEIVAGMNLVRDIRNMLASDATDEQVVAFRRGHDGRGATVTPIPSPQDVARALVPVLEGSELHLSGLVMTVWEANTYETHPGLLILDVGPNLTDTTQVRLYVGTGDVTSLTEEKPT